MIAAIYARKSTEQNGVADEAKSVTRQVEHATEYARAKGWTVDPRHVYVDDAVSGAEWKHRPGFNALLAALDPRPPFDVLVVSELSRIGRDTVRVPYVVQQIEEAGVEIHGYLSGQAISVEGELAEMQTMLHSLAASFERRRARQRTYDAMLRKARGGHVTGNRCFGYDNVVMSSPEGHRLHVERKVNEAEGAVIRRIYELCASGLGLTRIAKKLNAERVPPPRNHTTGWAPTAIREILHRPLYRGEIVWGKGQKAMRGGAKVIKRRPESEWLRIDAPALRIVSAELARAAEARMAATRTVFARVPNGRLVSHPSRLDLVSPYLLAGLAYCTTCNGALIVQTRDFKRERRHLYGCSYHQKRGQDVCGNNVQIPHALLDGAVLGALAKAFDAKMIERAIEEGLARYRSRHAEQQDRRPALERELAKVDKEIIHLGEAVKRGRATDALLGLLETASNRRKGVARELAALDGTTRLAALDGKRLSAVLRAGAADVEALLGKSVPQARQMLRKVLVGRLPCEGFVEGGRRGYRFTGLGTYGRLVTGEATLVTSDGDPGGIRRS